MNSKKHMDELPSDEDSEDVPKLLSIGRDVCELLDDPPETLPSFVVENNGEWMCRKCKGRKFYEAHNHRIFYYDGKWRRRCASCAGKVRQRQRQGKRNRDCMSYRRSALGKSADKENVPIHEIGSDPLDRVIPLKSAPSQRPSNGMAPVRHSVVHVPTRDIVASPDCLEIRENEKKRILFYGPIESLCYKTAEKTVGGVIYDVHPFIRLELAPLTDSKFSVRLSSVQSEKKIESDVSESATSSGDPYTTFLLRWDKDYVQLWQDKEPLLSVPLRGNEIFMESAGSCTTVRSNIANVRLAIIENQSFEEPVIKNVVDTSMPPSGSESHNSTRALLVEGSGLGSAEEARSDHDTDQWAAKTLKSLQSSPDGYSPQQEQSNLRLSTVQCGSETLPVFKSDTTGFICGPPKGSSSSVNVWVPRRVTRDGFQHEVTPHIQVLNTSEKIKLMDAKDLLGPLKDWTLTNFVAITRGEVTKNPEPPTLQTACNEQHSKSTTNKSKMLMTNGAPLPPTQNSGNIITSSPHLLCGQDARLKGNMAPVFVPPKSSAAHPPPQYPPAYFPKVLPSASQVMGSTEIPTGFQVFPEAADSLAGGEKTSR